MEKQPQKQITITGPDGKPINVPPEGALGLLALGYKGLIAWRQARFQYMQKLKSEGKLKEMPVEKISSGEKTDKK